MKRGDHLNFTWWRRGGISLYGLWHGNRKVWVQCLLSCMDNGNNEPMTIGITECFGQLCSGLYSAHICRIKKCLMPLGQIQAWARPNLPDELFWVQDLNINFRSLVPEARACSLLSLFREPFDHALRLTTIRNKLEKKGVGTPATLMKKFGRRRWRIARSLPLNLRNFLPLFPWEQSVSNLYNWRMMIFVVFIWYWQAHW